MLQQQSNDIYTVDAALPKNPIGRRMTLIKHCSKELLVHSPLYLNDALKAQIDKIGTITTIFIPNSWHKLDVESTHQKYPNAKIIAPKALKSILAPKIKIHQILEENWQDKNIEYHCLDGLKSPEATLYHQPSKTLIVADLFFNFSPNDFTGLTKVIMTLNQATKFGSTRLYRWAMIKDKTAFQDSLKAMIKKWRIETIIMSHGHIIKQNASELLKQYMY